MFYGGTLSTANYDSLLIGWASLSTLQSEVSFHAGNSKYTSGGAAATACQSLLNSQIIGRLQMVDQFLLNIFETKLISN